MNKFLLGATARVGAALLAVGLLAARPAAAQWVSQTSGLPAGSSIASLSIVDADNVWATAFDLSAVSNPNGTAPNSTYIRTTNSGSNWTVGTVPIPSAQTLVSVSAASAQVVWVACDDLSAGGGRVYYTTNGGTSWTRQLTTGFAVANNGFVGGVLAFSTSQALAAGNPGNANNFEIYYTTNAGTTWTAAMTPARLTATETATIGSLVTVPSPAVAGARPCWLATGAGRVLRSTDSGLTWAAATTGLTNVTALAFCSPTTGLAINENAPGTVATTTDGGATWTTRAPSGPLSLASVAGVPGTRSTFVSGGFDTASRVGSAYSTDGGVTWTALDAQPHTELAFLSGTLGYSGGLAASTTSGGMYRGGLPAAALATAATHNLAGLSLYPNPAPSAATLTGAAPGQAVQVFDALGRVAATATVGTDGTVALGGLASGLYVVRVGAGRVRLTVE